MQTIIEVNDNSSNHRLVFDFNIVETDNVFTSGGESVVYTDDEVIEILKSKFVKVNAYVIKSIIRTEKAIRFQLWIHPSFNQEKRLNTMQVHDLIKSNQLEKLIGYYISHDTLLELKKDSSFSYYFNGEDYHV